MEKVPCVLYGGGDTVHFAADERALKKLVFTPETYRIEIDIDGETTMALLQEVQFHPVTDAIIHVDFLRMEPGKPAKVALALKFVGQSEGCPQGWAAEPDQAQVACEGVPAVSPSISRPTSASWTWARACAFVTWASGASPSWSLPRGGGHGEDGQRRCRIRGSGRRGAAARPKVPLRPPRPGRVIEGPVKFLIVGLGNPRTRVPGHPAQHRLPRGGGPCGCRRDARANGMGGVRGATEGRQLVLLKPSRS